MSTAQGGELLVDISQHLVAITTGFTGADVLLFGVREGPGEIVVVVRGPHMSTTVRRKDRIAGIWINHDTMIFRSEEHTSELQSLMRISYAVFCLKKKKTQYRYRLII